MRLLIAVDTTTGGAGNVAQILALYFHEYGYEVGLLFKKPMRVSKYDISPIKIYECPHYSSGTSDIATVFAIRKIVTDYNPDLIITFLHTLSPLVLFSQYFSSIPIIVSERSNPFTNIKSKKEKIKRCLAYRRANLISVQFDVFKNFDRALNKKGRIVTIPNMILESNITKVKSEKNKISFVTLGSLYFVKRFDRMIDIFKLIHQHNLNVELNIYGMGPDEEKLKNKVLELDLADNIHFKGYTTDVYSCLAENDIYLMTSEREGFPNAMSEAMAVGLPIVAFECHEGLRDLVKEDYNGYLIPNDNNVQFAEKCCYLVENNDLRTMMGENSKEVASKYGIDRVMSIWKKYIAELVSAVN